MHHVRLKNYYVFIYVISIKHTYVLAREELAAGHVTLCRYYTLRY